MPLQFDRPVGATADVAELEYISALMQTEKLYLRQEGSVTARDIHFFLKSRYGVKIDPGQAMVNITVELRVATWGCLKCRRDKDSVDWFFPTVVGSEK